MSLLGQYITEVISEALWQKRLDELRKFSVEDLARFWDNLGDSSFYEGPEGFFDCADIHYVLNEKGAGHLCTV